MLYKQILTILLFIIINSNSFSLSADNWRSVPSAVLTQQTSINKNDGYRTVLDCQAKCILQESCLSFAFDSTQIGCYIYTERFGFNSFSLENRQNTIYYEKPIGYHIQSLTDNIGIYLEKTTLRDGNMYQYLGRFRSRQAGILEINNKLSNRNQINIIYNDLNVEQCAAKCLQNGGIMGNNYNKCVSFNYNPNTLTCILLSYGLDNNHVLRINNNQGYFYYDKIAGLDKSGCWISQTQCANYNNTKYIGHFEHKEILSTSNGDAFDINGKIIWESDCVEMAQWWHEDKCQNPVNIPTIAYWTGDGLNPTYIDWNSWDLTSGCVIVIPDTCKSGKSRFHITDGFRDSIGEEYFASGNSATKCFQRATEYHNYVCNGSSSSIIRLDYPTTGQYYIYPSPDCECDTNGYKIDTESNNLKYCRRKNIGQQCYRSKQGNYWNAEYNDILCQDTLSGCVAGTPSTSSCVYFRLDNENQSPCNNGYISNFNDGELHMDASSDIDTEEKCIALAETTFYNCQNDITSIDNQIKTWWKPSGKTTLFPDYAQPYTTTLIRGIDTDAKFVLNDPDSKIISLMPIRTGRWMSFTPTKNAFLRAISVWVYTPYQIDLTLTLYKGRGITDVEELTRTTKTINKTITDIHSTLYNRGAFITFEFDNINIWKTISGNIYTWEITIVENTGGEEISIGYDVGNNNYPLGRGDLRWDYLFITWIEDLQSTGILQGLETPPTTDRPWFEIWFIIGLVLWLLFLIFLLLLHCKRRQDEKNEREEDRQFQRELNERIRKQAAQQQKEKILKKKQKDGVSKNVNDDDKKYDSDNSNSDHNIAKSTRVPTEDIDDDGRTDGMMAGESKKKKKKKGLKVFTPKKAEFERVPSAAPTPLGSHMSSNM